MDTTEIIEGKDISVERTGEEERKLLFKDNLCAACGLCEKICPVNAIQMVEVGSPS